MGQRGLVRVLCLCLELTLMHISPFPLLPSVGELHAAASSVSTKKKKKIMTSYSALVAL